MNWDFEILWFKAHLKALSLVYQRRVDKIFAKAMIYIYRDYREPRYDRIYFEGVRWLDSL